MTGTKKRSLVSTIGKKRYINPNIIGLFQNSVSFGKGFRKTVL